MSEGHCTLSPICPNFRILGFPDSQISHLLKQFVIRQWICEEDCGRQNDGRVGVGHSFLIVEKPIYLIL